MTPKQFEKHLRSISYEELIQLLITLFSSSKSIQSIFSLVFDNDDKTFNKIVARFNKELDKVFNIHHYSDKAAQATLNQYKALVMNGEQAAELCLIFAEACIDFSNTFGDIDDKFEDLLCKSYREALSYAGQDEKFYWKNKEKLMRLCSEYIYGRECFGYDLLNVREKYEPGTKEELKRQEKEAEEKQKRELRNQKRREKRLEKQREKRAAESQQNHD